jgi:putative endonuclease
MEQEEKGQWFLYVLECVDGTLYTGISNDVEARLQKHNQGKGAKYTAGRRPVVLKGWIGYAGRSEASKAEYAFKQLNKEQKILRLRDMDSPGAAG